MELTQLAQFKIIAEKNSISKAAKELHVSQPALSTSVKKLEQELELELFSHTGNKICLNEAGKIALGHVQKILMQVEQMQEELRAYEKKHSGPRIGFCDHGPMWYCVPKLGLHGKEVAYSHYKNDADEKELLRSGEYDILITSDQLDAQDMISKPFICDRKYLSIPENHPLSKEKTISARDPRIGFILLFVLNDVFDKKQNPFWDDVEKEGQNKITKIDDYFLFSQMLKQPDVITTTTEIVRHYRNDGTDRVLIPFTDNELTIQYYLSYLNDKEAEMQEILFLLEACAKEIT